VTLFGLVFTPVFCLVIRWFTAMILAFYPSSCPRGRQ